MPTSVEKVHALVQHYVTREPENLQDSLLLLAAQRFAPAVLERLPEDPDELDELLDRVADEIRTLRSDPAPAALHEGEPA